MNEKFRTTLTALVTPMFQGRVDLTSLEKLLDFQIQNGVKDFVVNGTTGESPTVSFDEMKEVFSIVKRKSPQGHLVFGTGSNSTAKTVEDSLKAQQLGADAALVVVPYYNKPTQQGLYLHFKTVAEALQIPTILYNVPGRTITALAVETIEKLAKIPQIIGIKEASGNIQTATDIVRNCGKEFVLLSGDDGTYADFLHVGGQGVISVASHILPKEFVQMTHLSDTGDHQATATMIARYAKLIQLLFTEANPIPVKMALHWMGILRSPECRLPMTTLSENLHAELRAEMTQQGLL